MNDASLNESRRQFNRDSFVHFERRVLIGMDDRELAEWQSRFDQDEAQWRLAEHEWQRRITQDNIRAIDAHSRSGSQAALRAGFIGGFLGMLGGLLAPLVASKITESHVSKEPAISDTHSKNAAAEEPAKK